MNGIAASIVALSEKLAGTPFDFAFLGGSVLSLLVNDPTVDAIRVTKDVDVIVGVRSRNEFHEEERELEARGFRHDTSDDAPICRWIADGVVLDVLPMREEVLGWRSEWFEQALLAARTMEIEGHLIKVVTAPFFVALKLEAFEDRGKGDFIMSTDFEDVICLFNGRQSVVDEIMAEPERGCRRRRPGIRSDGERTRRAVQGNHVGFPAAGYGGTVGGHLGDGGDLAAHAKALLHGTAQGGIACQGVANADEHSRSVQIDSVGEVVDDSLDAARDTFVGLRAGVHLVPCEA